MENEKIKKALDDFEDDDFVASKETLSKEIGSTRDKYLKTKLELKNDINPEPEVKDDDTKDDDTKDDEWEGKEVKIMIPRGRWYESEAYHRVINQYSGKES